MSMADRSNWASQLDADFDKESVVTQVSVKSRDLSEENDHSKNSHASAVELHPTIISAAKAVLSRFTCFLGQWPISNTPALLGSAFMNEMNDQLMASSLQTESVTTPCDNIPGGKLLTKNITGKAPDLSKELFESPNTTFLCYNDCIVSIVELDNNIENNSDSDISIKSKKQTRLIVRN